MSESAVDDWGVPHYRGVPWLSNYKPLRTQVIQRVHEAPETGHRGRDETIIILCRQFYSPGLAYDVRRFVHNCDICGRTKIWRQRKNGLLRPLTVPDRP